MSKRVFVLLIVLMSLSLIGIISVQAYYINDSVQNEKERFKYNVKKSLSYVSNTIEEREFDNYFQIYQQLDNKKKSDSTIVSQLFFIQTNKRTNETLFYSQGVLEENYKLSSSLLDAGIDNDSLFNLKSLNQESKIEIFQNSDLKDKDFKQSPITRITNSGPILEENKKYFEKNFKQVLKRKPIYKRVSEEEIKTLLFKKLTENDIDIDYEFAIYSNDLATKVQSDNFENDVESTFSTPIFYDDTNQTPYKLLVNFPGDGKYILSSVIKMILLSVVFTLIIIIAYTSSLYQLIKQRKISEIKTDFINNMTHEFKTPIATINLALDSIKNPKIIGDKDKVLRYLNMIKEENKRMHAQVENVLRISKLEKNELNISKDRVNLHDLILDAITHVELIIEDRQGYIKTFLNAENSSFLANETHFTNVIVNILDNAIKYSPNAPKIEVYTENVGNNIILKIKDHGSGMSKAALKRVFEKFYREHTGNIHNVKGHGLGLAYVKRIVDDHQGHVSAESEKDNGSTFTIKLPIIT
ncbi:sensor histidine kinase [Thalassobellus suaedae]|uniref:histidine kinase n=1 Tax=Thalassobellus suaedae TaxID=3074124 RepID=A0ABY9Y0F0_9FLAO|nr:HAMP domain-containing sensor histidine kinase [Flavobacteriaceae bacterium HL-DH14]WNH11709.1 HAMP domain-containing sensor histidine kinase [Flavobacteriaceae bacterium HL-DH10]